MSKFLAPQMAVYTKKDGLEAAGAYTPVSGPVEYIRADVSAARIADLERQLAEAEVQEMRNAAVLSKAAYEGLSSLLLSVQQDCIAEHKRAEAAEAEAAKWQKAFAAQTRKLQIALNEGGDAVRAALQPKVKP